MTPEEPERRLVILEAQGSDDAAREDLPALDHLLFAGLTSVLMYAWGY